jgi:hypothetical protein
MQCPDVSQQVTSHAEAVTTHTTLIWLLAGVFTHMILHMVTCHARVRAIVALVYTYGAYRSQRREKFKSRHSFLDDAHAVKPFILFAAKTRSSAVICFF